MVDRFICTYSIELEYEEKIHHIEFSIYSVGNSKIWAIGRMFFKEGKIEPDTTLDIKQILEDNIYLFTEPLLNEYQKIIEGYKNSEPLWLMKFSILKTKNKDDVICGWVLETYVTNEKKYIKFDIKQGAPDFSMKKWSPFMNWESNTWYPGWKHDMNKQIKGFLCEWDYSQHYFKINNYHQKQLVQNK
jgi:hypothetical protein